MKRGYMWWLNISNVADLTVTVTVRLYTEDQLSHIFLGYKRKYRTWISLVHGVRALVCSGP